MALGPGEGCERIPGAPSWLINPVPNETRGHQRFGCAGAPSPAPSAAQLSEAAPWKRGSLLFSFCLEYFNFFLAFCVYLVLSFQASSLSLEAALSTSTGMAQKRIRSPQVVPLGSVFPLHQPWGGMPAP